MRNYEKLRETLNILGIFFVEVFCFQKKKKKIANYQKLRETLVK